MMNEAPTTEAVPASRRRRKSANAIDETRPVSRLQGIEERQYHVALEAPDVKAALHSYECAQAKRDSISRKLCGGSTHVTVDDLAHWEASLSDAKKASVQIATRSPILERHPVFAAVVAHS